MAQDIPPLDPGDLDRALSLLTTHEREVLCLASEGLTNTEIAAALGLPVEAAERLLADALAALDRALERRRRPWWKVW